MNPTICDAIHKHRLLRFFYNPAERLVEPHAYGVGDGEHELLRAYQISGGSASREVGWKLFRVAEMMEIAMTDIEFVAPRDGYMRNEPSMVQVYCEL